MPRVVASSFARWTAGALLVALAACSDETPPPPAVQHAPAASFDVPTGRIALAPVTIELPQGKGIGSFQRNVDCWVHVRSIMPPDFPPAASVTDEVRKTLAEAKLTVTAAAGRDIAAAGGADYLLVASVPGAHADMCIDNVFNEGPADIDAQVTLSWHLWSVRDNRVVYESSTTGTAHASDPAETIKPGVALAVADATRQLLQAAAVQQYLTYGHVLAPPVPVAAAPAAPPVPAGGAAPIPQPPPGFRPATPPPAPAIAEALPPLLIPVRTAHPPGTAIDAAAARRATVPVGTGNAAIALGDGYLLTSAAAVGDAVTVGIELQKGEVADARVLRRDGGIGVALLKTDGKLPPAIPLQPRRNAVGDVVYGVAPAGLVKGSFVAVKASGGSDRVKLEGALPGGPVLDGSGNVIGVLLPDGGFVSVGTAFRALQLGAQPSEE